MHSPSTGKHIHFIGIGGIGMSGLAIIAQSQGYTVSGCDIAISPEIASTLKEHDCIVYNHHCSAGCFADDISTVIYNTNIPKDHAELVRAQAHNLTIMHRAELLAFLMRNTYGIAVSGSHGKTTTTALIAHILTYTHADPTVMVGGIVPSLGSNARTGSSKLFVAEADESDRSFLLLPATIKVVTNINFEHAETYKNFDDLKETFISFLTKNNNDNPMAIVCNDDAGIQAILPALQPYRYITYGLTEKSQVYASNLNLHPTCSTFQIHHTLANQNSEVMLPIAGIHNVLNALAAIASCIQYGISLADIVGALASFKGVERRFCIRGHYKGATVIDDYGHHPVEIKATLAVARKFCTGKLIVFFQPHRFSRTQALWHDFITVFTHAPISQLIITDIYAAFEEPIAGLDSIKLVQEIRNSQNSLYSFYTPDIERNETSFYIPYEQIETYIHTSLEPLLSANDTLLFLGAGPLYEIALDLAYNQ